MSAAARERSLAPVLDIGGRPVGKGHPCYIVAEAGSNHDGELGQALALIDAAADARCDAVKFQVFRPEDLVTRTAPHARYLEGTIPEGRSIFDLFATTAMDRSWLPRLAAHSRTRRIHFLATPFDLEAIDLLVAHGVEVPAIKNASAELWHLPLIRRAAATGRPLLISTGMGDLDDVADAVGAAMDAGATEIALMQCTVRYPAPAEDMNLTAMAALRTRFGTPVGLSDHSLGTWAPIAAVALGANIVEKHFTLSRALPGPDHAFAIEPGELAQMVRDIRATEASLGDGRKVRRPIEEEIYAISRRNLVTARPLRRGDMLAAADLAVLRSALGIAPKHFDELVGRRVTRDIAAGIPLAWDDLEPR